MLASRVDLLIMYICLGMVFDTSTVICIGLPIRTCSTGFNGLVSL